MDIVADYCWGLERHVSDALHEAMVLIVGASRDMFQMRYMKEWCLLLGPRETCFRCFT